MNSVNISNLPYVHTRLDGDDGKQCTCTDVFLTLGLVERAEIEFELSDGNHFRLIRVAHKGKWRPGNEPHERTARTGTLNPTRKIFDTGHTSQTGPTPLVPQMSDPLAGFSWGTLYKQYDDACKRSGKFDCGS